MRQYFVVHKKGKIEHLLTNEGDLVAIPEYPGYITEPLKQQEPLDWELLASNPERFKAVGISGGVTIVPRKAKVDITAKEA